MYGATYVRYRARCAAARAPSWRRRRRCSIGGCPGSLHRRWQPRDGLAGADGRRGWPWQPSQRAQARLRLSRPAAGFNAHTTFGNSRNFPFGHCRASDCRRRRRRRRLCFDDDDDTATAHSPDTPPYLVGRALHEVHGWRPPEDNDRAGRPGPNATPGSRGLPGPRRDFSALP